MGNTNKTYALILTLIIAMSCLTLLTVKPVNAQSLPKPSVPEFTAEFIPNYINTTTTDPYTGTNTTTTQNLSTIKLTITNQQYSYSNGSTFGIYYNVRVKGHFGTSWSELYPTTQLLPSSVNVSQLNPNNYQNYEEPFIWGENSVYSYQFVFQSNSTYTIVSLSASDYSSNGQIDIQVEAMLGVNSSYYLPSNSPYTFGSYYPAIAYVSSSGWSNTQTMDLANDSVSILPSSNPTITPSTSPTPSASELTWFVIVSLLVTLFAVAIVFKHRKNR